MNPHTSASPEGNAKMDTDLNAFLTTFPDPLIDHTYNNHANFWQTDEWGCTLALGQPLVIPQPTTSSRILKMKNVL